jgi:hypothetical protein
MGVSNNDYNHRLVSAEAIPENSGVYYNAAGKVAKSAGTICSGFCPQAIAVGERTPVIRGGTMSGLVGFTAGARLRVQADSTLGTAGTNPVVAIVKAEDVTTALILTANLDYGY